MLKAREFEGTPVGDGPIGVWRDLVELGCDAACEDLEVVLPEGGGEFRGEDIGVGFADPCVLLDRELLGDLVIVKDEPSLGILDVSHEGAMVHEGLEDVIGLLTEAVRRWFSSSERSKAFCWARSAIWASTWLPRILRALRWLSVRVRGTVSMTQRVPMGWPFGAWSGMPA